MSEINIAILGAGRSGKGAARLADVLNMPAKILTDNDTKATDHIFDNYSVVVVSPGIPPSSALYRKAVEIKKEIISELEFAARYFGGRYLAITGTNGKTTTTELTTELLLALGINAVAAGNIGHPFSTVAAEVIEGKLSADTVPVIEVSSFQLERVRDFAPVAAAMLNVAEDHLDRYPRGIDEYRQIKERIFNGVSLDNRIYGITCCPCGSNSRFSVVDGMLKFGALELLKFDDIKLKGRHNQENVIAALELVSRIKYLNTGDLEVLRDSLKNFAAGEHRVEKVLERNGITFIDDSKGTNPAAVVAALNSVPGDKKNILLILGGLDKGMDFSPLGEYEKRIKKAYILGECRQKICDTLHDRINCELFDSFDQGVLQAANDAVKGDIVLLSPGCASWDMFNNYKERGKRFQKLIADTA
jgi:UDP-N-acetylmuramoylalanine--D-glutamate ligase